MKISEYRKVNEPVDDWLLDDVLQPWQCGPFSIGSIDEVNGEGATEVPSFTATRHELLLLVKHWAKIAIEIEYYWFACQGVSSSDIRERPYAWRRIATVANVLGEMPVKGAVKEAVDELGQMHEPRCWNVFLNGTEEELRAMQEEIDANMREAVERSSVLSDEGEE